MQRVRSLRAVGTTWRTATLRECPVAPLETFSPSYPRATRPPRRSEEAPTRAIQWVATRPGRLFWLRPDPACRAIIDGVFGKALALYTAVRLHAYDAQSNHLHYLCSADDDPEQLPLFIDYVHGNIARQRNDLRGREGVFWGRRGSVIAVLDADAQIDRLRYILAQGPKSVTPRATPS